MLDISTAKLVKKAIDNHFKEAVKISLEEVSKMTPAPVVGRGGGHTIISCQYGDLTIMVWIQIRENGTIVRAVKSQAW
jgi:hypothetical protein